MKKWYVIRVLTGREEEAKTRLEKHIKEKGMETLISRVLVPKEKVTEIRSGKKKVMERKIYSGYILVEMEYNQDSWLLVRETPGIGDFLGGRKPTPMSQIEIDKILITDTTTQEQDKPKLKIPFKKGDRVRIKEGPFNNFEGVVEEIDGYKGLVKVISTIFGRPTPVELEYWQVETV